MLIQNDFHGVKHKAIFSTLNHHDETKWYAIRYAYNSRTFNWRDAVLLL